MVSERHEATVAAAKETDDVGRPIDLEVRLMYSANEGDLDWIRELLESGVKVNFKDIDGHTALHIAACNGLTNVVSLLLDHGFEFDPSDCLESYWSPASKSTSRTLTATQLSTSQPAMDSPTSFHSCLTMALNSILVIA
nr:ankyrin repeat domain-containing protein 54 [Quercus suber]